MIDLIIPYYNNPQGIITTLRSINFNVFKVTIIDDNSSIYLPSIGLNAQVFRYNINEGPGYARQWGINHTSNPYIMFLDTSDVFTSQEIQYNILDSINTHPETNMFFFPYNHYGTMATEGDNRMHGKLYKRKFIEDYNITFPLKSSYLNEDIGFNRACRIILEATNSPILYIDCDPIIEQICDQTSLTQINNREVLYKDQTRALSLATIHTIDICRKNNIDVQKEIDCISVALYYWFIRTAAERPEYITQAWNGARIFFKKFENEIKPNHLILGNKKLKQYASKINFTINILRFIDEIKKFEIIPSRYLTLN